MAQIEGLQVNIVAKTDQLQKGLDEVKKGLASVATESERQAERISNPLKGAADAIEARYGNLAGTLATRLIGLINPATLAATAITVVGAGLISYYQSLQDKVVDVDAALQTHGKLIKDLKAAYGEAMSGLDQYTQQSENSLKTRIAGSLFELDQAVKQTARTITDQFGYTIYRSFKNAETGVIEFGNAFPTLPAKFAPFREAIERLQTSITNGNPDYVTFKNSVEAIGAAAVGVNQPLATTASELANLAAKGAAAQQAIAANTAALSAMDPEARKAAAALETYNSAISKLLTIAPAKVTDRYKADEAYLEAIQNAGGDENKIRQAVQARNDTLRRIEAEEALKAKPATTDNSAEKLAREQEQITKRLEMLVTGWGTEEEQLAAHLVRNQDLINQAKAKEAIDDQTHKILMLGAEEEYQKKIQRIRDITNDQALSSTANMFGSLQRLTESFGKKGTALAKAFGIAQALINTYVGVTKALSTLPPPASYAAAAATLAAGMAQVASIRSISDSGKGGGGGASASSGGGAAAAAAGGGGGGQPGGNSVYINLQGQTFGRDQVRDLVKQIADFQKDGGQVVFA